MDRVLRGGIHTAIMTDSRTLFLAARNDVWRVDIVTGEVTLDLEIPNGRRLLNFALVPAGPEGDLVPCFGEYFDNPTKMPVGLWVRRGESSKPWKRIEAFGSGVINHVHNIIPSADGSTLYVLTGDFGDSAAIFLTNPDFCRMRPLVQGQQDFRAVWAWEVEPRILYYATDSQLQSNKVILLDASNEETPRTVILDSIPGSGIYAAFADRHVIFSTAVEPGEPSGKFWRDAFDRKRGPGILSNDASIHVLTKEGYLQPVFFAPKDSWPTRLAQFGTFTFPGGILPNDRFWAYGQAIRGYDDACLCFRSVA
jgi:hypothetical protein